MHIDAPAFNMSKKEEAAKTVSTATKKTKSNQTQSVCSSRVGTKLIGDFLYIPPKSKPILRQENQR